MEEAKELIYFNLLNFKLGVSEAIVIQWIIILICLVFSIWVKCNLKNTADKKQSVIELLVESVNNLVKGNMGEGTEAFVPYIGTLIIFLFFMNIAGLFGVEPPTMEFSVTIALAAVSFIVIQGYAIKNKGIVGYFVGYARPVSILLPINIMERIMTPLSLSLRLFGNITAATIVMELLYDGLAKTPLGIGRLAIPVPFQFYFDVFDGGLQMLIFVMLTMINIKIISDH